MDPSLMAAGARRRRLRYELHSALGALTGILLFAICYTGAVSVFRSELELWSQPERQVARPPAEVAAATPAVGLDAVVAQLQQGGRLGEPALVRFPAISHGAWDVVTQRAGSARIERIRIDAATGTELPAAQNDMAGAVFRLHGYLLLPGSIGRYAVGILGLCMLASLWTGLRIRRHLLRDVLRWPRGTRPRLFLTDLHRVLGVWVLPFHVLIAITGVYLGVRGLALGPAILGRFDGDRALARAALDVPAQARESEVSPPSLEALVSAAERRVAGFEPNAVLLRARGTPTEQVSVLGRVRGAVLLPEHDAVRVVFSGADGAPLGVRNALDAHLLVRVYHAMGPLHFAEFGGAPMRVLYFALGVAGALLALTGTLVWTERGAARRFAAEESAARVARRN